MDNTDAVALVQRLQQHGAWVNRNLLAAAAQLSEEQLRRVFPIGQGSVWKSLTHMYGAEYVWLAALEGDDQAVALGDARGQLPGNQAGENPMHTVGELQDRWTALAKRWSDYLANLRAAALNDTVYKCSSTSPTNRFSACRSTCCCMCLLMPNIRRRKWSICCVSWAWKNCRPP